MGRTDRLAPWLIGAAVLSVSIGAVYLVAQQIERLGADDAGTRLGSEIASDIPGARADIESRPAVDLANNLQPFFVVYDQFGMPEFGTGYFDGQLASVPVGVIETAFANGSNSVTWQPDDGLRFATVAVRQGDEVVLAGQSLAPSESRTTRIEWVLFLVWLVGVVVLSGGAALHWRMTQRPSAQADS